MTAHGYGRSGRRAGRHEGDLLSRPLGPEPPVPGSAPGFGSPPLLHRASHFGSGALLLSGLEINSLPVGRLLPDPETHRRQRAHHLPERATHRRPVASHFPDRETNWRLSARHLPEPATHWRPSASHLPDRATHRRRIASYLPDNTNLYSPSIWPIFLPKPSKP